MKENHEKNRFEEHPARRSKTRSKQIPIDFMRVEDAGTMPAMGRLELETRRKIAEGSETPLDELIAAEEKSEKTAGLKSGRRTVRNLIRDGVLTERQELIYRLSYEEKLSGLEIARRLGIKPATVWRLRQNIRKALAEGIAKRKRAEIILKKAAYLPLTRKQKRLLKLRFSDGLSAKEIAVSLGKTKWGVYQLLRRTLKKLFSA